MEFQRYDFLLCSDLFPPEYCILLIQNVSEYWSALTMVIHVLSQSHHFYRSDELRLLVIFTAPPFPMADIY